MHGAKKNIYKICKPNRIVSTLVTNSTETSEYKLCCCANVLRAQYYLRYSD